MAHKFLPKAPTTKNGPEQFTGDVWVDPIAYPQEAGHGMIVARVRFAPGAHTAWNSHAKGQTLHVTSGVALFGMRDGTAVEVVPGETHTAPRERNTGTAPRRKTSWSTPRSSRTRRIRRRAPGGSNTSPRANTADRPTGRTRPGKGVDRAMRAARSGSSALLHLLDSKA